jgi:DNA-binding NarL/FixJ family response regulator
MTHLLDKFQINPEYRNAPTEQVLTDRELEVYRQIGAGLSTGEIAANMCLSVKTIGTYRDRIKQKLCLKSGAELIRCAVLWAEKESFGKNNPSLVG